tara:strand:+ start:949 stop:1302 length:354 start_codon:yes stop_codon:yes gene_type:complete
MACIRQCFLKKKKSLIVLPFVSIVAEKCEVLRKVTKGLKTRVLEYHGSQGKLPPPRGNQLIVATIERAASIVNCLAEENRLSEIGLVVIDECHMIDDMSRGVVMETLLTKIQFMGKI